MAVFDRSRCVSSAEALIQDSSNVVHSNRAPATDACRWLAHYGDALYHYAIARLRSSHAAEDVVQETLLAAMSASGSSSFDGRSSELTWLTGILRHKVIDHLRLSFREAPAEEEFAAGCVADDFDRDGNWLLKPAIWHGISADNPHALLERSEFRNTLVSCLAAIPRRQARLFMLREADGMSSEAICLAMKISPTNLWQLLHRTRLRLRQCLGFHGFNEMHPDRGGIPPRAKGSA